MPFIAPFIPAIIGAGAAIFTGSEAAKSQKKAAKRAEKAQAPAREARDTALRKLGEITERGPGGPLYEFRRREEEASLEAQMRAQGTFSSGRFLEASRRIGQQLTAEESGAHVGRLESLAGLGQKGVSSTPYYAAGAAEAGRQDVFGREISSLAGTVEAERRRREEERKRIEKERNRGDETLSLIGQY